MIRPFRILEASTVEEAAEELRCYGDRVKVYAGGAELLLLLRYGLIEADYLLDIKGIENLNRVYWNGAELRVGATVTHRCLETDEVVREHTPMFAYAESQVGNIRVRSQGTIGGNLCFADPHADPATALLVHDACVKLATVDREREMALADFLIGTYETALEPGELLIEVGIPPLPPGWGRAYLRLERLYRPTVNVGVAAALKDGVLKAVKLAVGCVGPKAVRLLELESKLVGIRVRDVERIIDAEVVYLRERLQPVGDVLGSEEYKIHVTHVLIKRALSEAMARSGWRGCDQP